MKTIKTIVVLAAACSLLTTGSAWAQGTAFTYQGRLNDTNNGPVTGFYDFQFQVFDAATAGNYFEVPYPPLFSALPVSNGLFTVTLDFGSGVFTGPPRWLQINVRTNGMGVFTILTPRQALIATPYAMTARSVTGPVSIGQLNGVLASTNLAGTYSGALALTNAGNSFSGNGGGITNVNATLLGGLSPSQFWNLAGNSGTTAGMNFIGTADSQPLELRVNGLRGMRYENGGYSVWATGSGYSNPNGAPNLIGGSPVNFVASGVVGAVIAGGGATNYFGSSQVNSIAGDFGAIGGGYNNTIQTNAINSTIGGGELNTIQLGAYNSTIGGGNHNIIKISAYDSAIGGGEFNTIQIEANHSTIGGGSYNTIQTNAYFSTICGGSGNLIQTNVNSSTIGGGDANTIGAYADQSTIGGGGGNLIQSIAYNSTIGGGEFNWIQSRSYESVIGGGYGNTIQTSTYDSVIVGGDNNTIQTNAYGSTIGGGEFNTIQTNASDSTIGGGVENMIQPNAYNSTIGGGYLNINTGKYATIPGGDRNVATNYAFAAGHFAQANHTGSFVWADNSANVAFADTANNQFLIRASGGVVLQTSSLRFLGAGADTSTPVFTHKATAANINGNKTYINNPVCNGQPNAILIVTENWNAGNNVGNSKVVGVYYDAGAGQWTIFVDDGTAMPIGVAYNVMVTLP